MTQVMPLRKLGFAVGRPNHSLRRRPSRPSPPSAHSCTPALSWHQSPFAALGTAFHPQQPDGCVGVRSASEIFGNLAQWPAWARSRTAGRGRNLPFRFRGGSRVGGCYFPHLCGRTCNAPVAAQFVRSRSAIMARFRPLKRPPQPTTPVAVIQSECLDGSADDLGAGLEGEIFAGTACRRV